MQLPSGLSSTLTPSKNYFLVLHMCLPREGSRQGHPIFPPKKKHTDAIDLNKAHLPSGKQNQRCDLATARRNYNQTQNRYDDETFLGGTRSIGVDWTQWEAGSNEKGKIGCAFHSTRVVSFLFRSISPPLSFPFEGKMSTT
jgi:hypothetical protein